MNNISGIIKDFSETVFFVVSTICLIVEVVHKHKKTEKNSKKSKKKK